jgi:hypothetical protein
VIDFVRHGLVFRIEQLVPLELLVAMERSDEGLTAMGDARPTTGAHFFQFAYLLLALLDLLIDFLPSEQSHVATAIGCSMVKDEVDHSGANPPLLGSCLKVMGRVHFPLLRLRGIKFTGTYWISQQVRFGYIASFKPAKPGWSPVETAVETGTGEVKRETEAELTF